MSKILRINYKFDFFPALILMNIRIRSWSKSKANDMYLRDRGKCFIRDASLIIYTILVPMGMPVAPRI